MGQKKRTRPIKAASVWTEYPTGNQAAKFFAATSQFTTFQNAAM